MAKSNFGDVAIKGIFLFVGYKLLTAGCTKGHPETCQGLLDRYQNTTDPKAKLSWQLYNALSGAANQVAAGGPAPGAGAPSQSTSQVAERGGSHYWQGRPNSYAGSDSFGIKYDQWMNTGGDGTWASFQRHLDAVDRASGNYDPNNTWAMYDKPAGWIGG